MADNCVLHKMSGKLNLPYQAFALLCLVFPFPNHLQVSSPATSGVFLANSSCGASRSAFLLFLSPLVVLKILFFNKHPLLQSHAASTHAISQLAMQGFALLPYTLSIPINHFFPRQIQSGNITFGACVNRLSLPVLC